MQVSFLEALNCQQQSFVTNYEFIEEEENSIRNRQKWNNLVIIFNCVPGVKITLQYDDRIRPV